MLRQKLYNKGGGIILFLLLSLSLKAQINLVLNPSFEKKTFCGTFFVDCGGSTINSWYSPTYGSPDWYNSCAGPSFSVPQNYSGYQFPRSGESYAGLGYFTTPLYREYITGHISPPLLLGKKYCVTFYVSCADSMWYAGSAMGAYLSATSTCDTSGNQFFTGLLPYAPQIENPLTNILSNKIDWVPISGEYIASGSESYITIGNFYGDPASHYRYVGGGGMGNNIDSTCYYFIDDISVREIISAHAGVGNSTPICGGDSILIGQDTATPGISYQWLPTAGLSKPYAAQTYAAPMVTTTYTLTVINDSMKGCSCPDSVSSSSVTVNVCQESVFVPDAFSPNNDGQNDVFLAHGNNISTFYIAIFDRWGNKVFESQNISKGWDGTYKGKPQNAGTYMYYANGTYNDGLTFNKKGDVTLVR